MQKIMWTRKKVEELLKDLHAAGIENNIDYDDGMAYDIADGVLFDYEGLEDFMKNEMKISNPAAYIANYIP